MSETIFEQWERIRENVGRCTCGTCWSAYLRVFIDEDAHTNESETELRSDVKEHA